ncbi:MAG: hypothetical protein KDK39_17140 [Leptospiraceae bacterium]|nr:hypothetical protein [Leptospiraceae bacterium]
MKRQHQISPSKSLSVKSRLLLNIGFVFLVFVGTIGIAFYFNHYIQSSFLQASQKVNLTREAQVSFKRQVQEWKNILLRGQNPKDYSKYKQQFLERYQEVDVQLTALGLNLKNSKPDWQAMQSIHVQIGQLQSRYVEALRSYDQQRPESIFQVDKKVRGLDRAPTVALDELAARFQAEMQTEMQQIKAQMLFTFGLLFIFCVASLSALNIPLFRIIHNNLQNTLEHQRQLIAGNLQPQTKTRIAEFRQIEENLNELGHQLSEMVTDLSDAHKQIHTAADKLHSSSNSVLEINQSQSATMQETSAAIEELSASTKLIDEAAVRQRNAVDQSTLTMQQMKTFHRELDQYQTLLSESSHSLETSATEGHQSVLDTEERMQSIQSSSTEILKIIGMINEVSERTNLLSLNASIEAARAGEQGKGFAVVAHEIGQLAASSAEYAQRINTLLMEAVRGIEQSSQKSKQSRVVFEHILQGVEQLQARIGSVTTAMTTLSGQLSRFDSAMTELASLSQGISSSTSEQSRAADEITREVTAASEILLVGVENAQHLKKLAADLLAVTKNSEKHITWFQTS